MRTYRSTSALLFAAALGVSATSAAQLPAGTSTAPDEALNETTRELFTKGVKASQQQKWDQCRAAFLAAFGVKKLPQIAGNLAVCEAKLGLHRDAAEHIALFLSAQKPDTPKERLAAAEEVLREASAKIATVRIAVDRSGAEVLVDGRAIGDAPLATPIFLTPGAHTIEARQEGYVTARRSLDAQAGASVEVALKLAPIMATPPVVPPVVPVVERGPRTAVLVSGGALTGVALVLGTAFAVVSNGKARDAVDDHAALAMTGPMPCAGASAASTSCTRAAAAVNAKRAFANAAFWSFVGAGLAGAGTLTYALAAQRSTTRTGLRVLPAAGPQGAGIEIRGAW
jgi:hypothetical protein